MERFQKYLDYISNTGGSPLVEWFDDDWEPIGLRVRLDMKEAGLIYERDGKVFRADEKGDSFMEWVHVKEGV